MCVPHKQGIIDRNLKDNTEDNKKTVEWPKERNFDSHTDTHHGREYPKYPNNCRSMNIKYVSRFTLPNRYTLQALINIL